MQSSCSHTVAPAPTTPPVGTAKDTKGQAKGPCPPLGLGPPLRWAADPAATRETGEGLSLGRLQWVEVSPAGQSKKSPPPPDFPVTHLCECVSLRQEGTGLGAADLLCSSALQVVELFKTNAAKGARCHAIGSGTLLYGIYTLCPSNSLKKAEAK